MEKRYRIKQECKKYVDIDIRDLSYTKGITGVFTYSAKNSGIGIDCGFSDEMFELIEEKEKIELCEYGNEKHNFYLVKHIKGKKLGEVEFPIEDIRLCEKALNGELVEAEDNIYNLDFFSFKIKDNLLCVKSQPH